MAKTSSGWLKPRDLTARATARRALELLAGYLDEDQQAEAERFGGFSIDLGSRVFWIPLDGAPWCAFADDGRVEKLCIAPDKRAAMPDGDVTLTYLLWIKLDPDAFLREANTLATRHIDWPDSPDELSAALAELASPSPPRPRTRKPARQKKPIRRSRISIDADQVAAIFARHGKTAPADVIRKLTT